MLTCKTIKAAAMEVDEAEMAELKESLAAKQLLLAAANARVNVLEAEVDTLKKENRELKKRKNAGSVTNITNNITVNLPPFRELCRYLPASEEVLSLLNNPASAIPKYIEVKYFQGEEPSIVLPNVNKPELRIVERGTDGLPRWVTVDKDDTIDRMVVNGLDDLDGHYDASRRAPAYKSWIRTQELDQTGFDKKPAYKKLKKDVEKVILSHRK